MTALPGPMDLAREGARHGGRQWYRRARRRIRDYCDATGGLVCPWELADILSLCSPRVTVAQSVQMAEEYLATGEPPARCIPSVRVSILHWEATGTIRGPKTAAFARALRGDRDAVVVDVWVWRALRMEPGGARSYRRAEHTIRCIAGRLGWPPADTQAAIWRGVRRHHNRSTTELLLPTPALTKVAS